MGSVLTSHQYRDIARNMTQAASKEKQCDATTGGWAFCAEGAGAKRGDSQRVSGLTKLQSSLKGSTKRRIVFVWGACMSSKCTPCVP